MRAAHLGSHAAARRRDNPVLRGLAALLLAAVMACPPAMPSLRAQDLAPASTGAEPPVAAAARLDAAKSAIDAVEATLTRGDIADSRLQDLRADLDPVAAQMLALAAELAPRIEAAKARLAQLGPKPAAGAPPEAAEISVERGAQEKLFNDLDATARRARVLAVQAGQISGAIAARRRAAFAHALFARSTSILSPSLWLAVSRELPSDARAVATLAEDWVTVSVNRLSTGERTAFAALLALIAALYRPAWRVACRIRGRTADAAPTRLRQALAALRVAVATAAVPVAATFALRLLLEGFDLSSRLGPLGQAAMASVALVAVVAGLARGYLAPKSPNWRLPPLTDDAAKLLYHLAVTLTAIVAVTKFVEALNDFIAVALPTAVATRALGAAFVALALMDVVRKAREVRRRYAEVARSARLEHWVALARMIVWTVMAVLLAAVTIGYVAFAAFLVEQVIVVAGTVALLHLLVALADEGIAPVLKPTAGIGRWLAVATGLRAETLDQTAILLTGAVRIALLVAAGLLVLAPWRIESGDLAATIEAAFFGFTVGEVTISLSTIIASVLMFALIVVATRTLQRWLEVKFLPHTRLDAGLRNSIKTSLGYGGVILALLLALSHLGLSFERLTIVAGALSVGIGFGLQSVVNNFVSGLILLWERAVRVGDWIAVGEEQGFVRRINVRSTEIETFDRALLIMPNSSLISGMVKNWVRNDRVGRIRLPFTLPLATDPDAVRTLLIAAAKAHDLVLAIPAPQVFFTALNEANLRFELTCFVDDVESAVRVTSDLLFDIHGRFKSAGLVQPPAPPVMSNPALDKIDAWLSARSR